MSARYYNVPRHTYGAHLSMLSPSMATMLAQINWPHLIESHLNAANTIASRFIALSHLIQLTLEQVAPTPWPAR